MPKTAWIDLTKGTVEVEETPLDLLYKFIGSRGYAAKILYDMVPETVGPYDPENLLIFSTGPLTGSPWPSAARYTVTAKSPATGAYGYANSSGFFGPELKRAGYDALVFKGRAKSPVYLSVIDDEIKIQPAEGLWGKTVDEVEALLTARVPGGKVSAIGPAGERRVKFAAIINDLARAAARTGMGAVMGSKNLKAIVAKGTKRCTFPKEFTELSREAVKKIMDNVESQLLGRWGTVFLIEGKNIKGDLPTKNHIYGQFPMGDRVDAKAIDKYVVKKKGCYACPIKCARVSVVPDGPYKVETEGPEYETTDALGPMIWNGDPELVIYCNRLCNDLGLDTISTGVVLAFAMEAHEKGLLSDEKLSLEWGDPETIVGLIKKIAYREGIGDLLAEGVKVASERIGGGSEHFALHVKGVEVPRQEGRALKGFGLAHATSNRGADHLYALPVIDTAGMADVAQKLFPQCYPEIMEITSEKYKPEMVAYGDTFNAIADSVGVCKFTCSETYAQFPEDLARALVCMGAAQSVEGVLEAAERIVNLERMYNVRHGFDRKDDTLPARFLKDPLDVYVRPQDIEKVPPEKAELLRKGLLVDLDYMLDRYYDIRGWDRNGVPKKETLERLGLGQTA